ncbi:MAG: hypothetical protein B6245_06435 [Desulfobacteraceae bacterium 4572_88]|nr:MAG: hypothetical protein B6245_06435 [Desulfobacteraceae bacterium 4572_88]
MMRSENKPEWVVKTIVPEAVYTDRQEFPDYFHKAALNAAGRRTMSTVLLGQRRMGKTEIFKRVVNWLFSEQDPKDPEAVVPVCYSFPEAPMDRKDFAAQYLENFIRYYVGFRTGQPNLVSDEPESEELISLAEDARSLFPFTRTLGLMLRKYKALMSGQLSLPHKTALEPPPQNIGHRRLHHRDIPGRVSKHPAPPARIRHCGLHAGGCGVPRLPHFVTGSAMSILAREISGKW